MKYVYNSLLSFLTSFPDDKLIEINMCVCVRESVCSFKLELFSLIFNVYKIVLFFAHIYFICPKIQGN